MCELNIIHRFNDNQLLQDAYTCSNGGTMDFNRYDNTEGDLALCWTNKAVDKIIQKWNDYYCPDNSMEVTGFNQIKFK